MSERIEAIDAETLSGIRRTLRTRERTIVDNMLQVPDYPPLPACPGCHAATTAIGHDEDAVWFQPCGHRFRITEQVKMDMRP